MTEPATGSIPQAHLPDQPVQLRAAVLTVSDTRTPENDHSGAFLRAALEAAGHRVLETRIVPDEARAITEQLQAWLDAEVDLILTTGGTGITGRDVTIPAVEALLTKPLPGFGELFRMLSYHEVGAAAMLSRAIGGLAGRSLIFALPGSKNAVQTAWDRLLVGQLQHLAAEVHRQGQP
ncbi:MogA/MoaB family molybdenum cofactor biosynthesis protein [Deinococcus radiophilus]|uniref:Molybdenum cofactor biosynthesis protein B n=1 Tax=Deinococcus radiophilus TaxID=32062 RepID=A0A3S0I616_9DEIO|nr:molybdenum cofactor biosynthesis protein B [Deinococcus radiophilus]RTR28298.1 molybdenum cofactor biosynthesis protein MoaB [Deinococcus radiophilus]UFA51159.1 molybdenum cofactor biosynthesis protein MoaB [Deinococcus radiophilus]